MLRRTLLACLLIYLHTSTLSAQRRTPSAPPNTGSSMATPSQGTELEVHVSLPGDRPVQESIHVVLESGGGKQLADGFTNQDGIAVFHSVRTGNYRLRLTGMEILETRTDNITIYRGEAIHMEQIRVSPKNPELSSPGGTVSASELNIPKKARKEMDKGVEALAKGDLAQANERLEKAIRIYPEYAQAWNNLGVVKIRANDPEAAKTAWEHAIAADNKLSPAYLNLARLAIAQKRMADAEDLIRRALAPDPQEPSALLLLSTAKAMNGEWDEALASARRIPATADHRQFAEAHRIAAEALVALGQPANAITEYKTYLRNYPDSPHANQVRQRMSRAEGMMQAQANPDQH